MKKLFTALACLLGLSCSYAQHYTVPLDQQSMNIPENSFYVSSVIDARLQKNNIGWVQRGLGNVRRTAVLEPDVPQALMHFFSRHLAPGADRTGLIVKILKMDISEETRAFSESAYAEVTLQFLTEKNPGEYLQLYEAVAKIERKGVDVTAGHARNLAAALEDCFKQLAAQNFPTLLAEASTVSAAHLNDSWIELGDSLNFPILRDQTYRPGVYFTFRQFRNNAPDYTPQLFVEKTPRTSKAWKGTDEVRPYVLEVNPQRNVVKKKPLKDVWGFSDGEQVYINYSNRYYPLEKGTNVFTFSGHVVLPYSVPAVVAGGVLGGAIGGAIAGAATAGMSTGNSPAEYVLDLQTGKVKPMEKYSFQSRQRAKIMVYFRENRKVILSPVQIIFQNQTDTLRTELQPNTYAEIDWQSLQSDLSLCLQDQPRTCHTFVPDVSSTTYYEYVATDPRSNGPYLKPVPTKEGEFYIRQIRYAQEVVERRSQKKQRN